MFGQRGIIVLICLEKQFEVQISRCLRTVSGTNIKVKRSTTYENRMIKWHFLEHKGPVFAPPHELLPDDVKFYYDETPIKLSKDAEEVACFYASMLDHEYTTRNIFNTNFFDDWRMVMTKEEKNIIRTMSKCNFRDLHAHLKGRTEEKKKMSKEEKQEVKEANERLTKEYGYCKLDDHIEKISSFKLEPPGLFRGRGDHPKQGMLKRRVLPEDIIINCSKDSVIPDAPPGHQWKEVRHDNTVMWLASWVDNISNRPKYIQLDARSAMKGNQDMTKYDSARGLDRDIEEIRSRYMADLNRKARKTRQCATATYLIDKLALRAGNEKDEDSADTVGCCSLRCEHLKLHEEMDGNSFVVELNFLGKDSIRYHNLVSVHEKAFKNLKIFMNKQSPKDDVFELLSTRILNSYLSELKKGLTSKVFRTYNASHTLQHQLDLLTEPHADISEKLDSYQAANRAVAVLCNHQKTIPKNFDEQLENLQDKINSKKLELAEMQKHSDKAGKVSKATKGKQSKAKASSQKEHTRILKKVELLKNQIDKMEKQIVSKQDNRDIALNTSKNSYLDPRISVAWCKKWEIPLEKVYNKSQRERFAWANATTEDYRFTEKDKKNSLIKLKKK